jgi:SNF2 family DNA or RNA helicase
MGKHKQEDIKGGLAKPEAVALTVAPTGRVMRLRREVTQRRSLDSLKVEPAQKRATPTRRGRRQSARNANKILVSDTLGYFDDDDEDEKPKSKPKLDTARNRVREEIAAQTMVKRDTFILSHKNYFLPLLPENNYVSKLAKFAKSDAKISEYTELAVQPKGVTATMKPYQLSGLSFLVHMYNNGMSGMLGDEMGLGKTLQTLSLFQYLEERDAASGVASDEKRPYLVICPLSVLDSWVNEARRWVPDLKVLRFHGPASERDHLKKVASGQQDRFGNETNQSKKRKADRKLGKKVSKLPSGGGKDNDDYKIVITTYETFMSEHSWFKKAFVWRYSVLDEGHRIKNNATDVSKSLQGLKAEYRLILTGTPLQNNLHEMWALLHWLYPEVFIEKTAELFKASFNLTKGHVSTTVIDDARRLLELVMLRRMKSDPSVNLGLPPKEEILLYVPLTPMQRFWYTRLLTNMGDGLLEDLFTDAKTKEKEALARETKEDQKWSKIAEIEKHADEKPDEWQETREIMKQALEQEKNDSSTKSAWMKLMNLVMQLRKCCSHPYLLPNAAPQPYELGEHVIRASGKFIVLEKLLKEAILARGKKVLIFSSFTRTLSCCEDLLALMGGRGDSFKYLRYDGATGRARRNLAIRMFNDVASPYKVMLLSTRAGGLGINLASASDVIFMDEDWNPQITLQAEARAHRIGQTKPVTIYKLCTQGTVEEQMMGRIRKKLYLSAKITESMQTIHGDSAQSKKKKRGPEANTDDMPQLDTSQLMSLVRRGAQTLSHPQIDVTEMLNWDFDTVIEKCRDKPLDHHIHLEGHAASDADEEKWLSVIERVECAVFDGKRYQRENEAESKTNVLPTEITRQDRRQGKNTTVIIGGYAVSKESLNCGAWEAVPTMAGKDPRLADVKRRKKEPINHEEHCHVCYDGGEVSVAFQESVSLTDHFTQVILCTGCPRTYHKDCLKQHFKADPNAWNGFYCPQHECTDCGKKTTDAGGLIFRCRWCPRGYCEDCLDWDKTKLIGENLPEYETLGMPENQQAYYIHCPGCFEWGEENAEAGVWFTDIERRYANEYDSWLESKQIERQMYEEQMMRMNIDEVKDYEDVDAVDGPETEMMPDVIDYDVLRSVRSDDVVEDVMEDVMAYEEPRGASEQLSSLGEPPSLVDSTVETPATVESGLSTPNLTLKFVINNRRDARKKRKVFDDDDGDYDDSGEWDMSTDPLMAAAKKVKVSGGS